MVERTLEQELERVKDIYSEIKGNRERIAKASAILPKLLEETKELEGDIDRHLLDKERIKDPLLDYCFRHFSGILSYYMGVEKRPVHAQCVFDMVPEVERFLKYVEERKGEKVLAVQGDRKETGIISGSCQFNIEEKCRYLHIPVEQLWVLNHKTRKWDKGKTEWNKRKEVPYGNLVYIDSDIFKHPSAISENGIWATDHSKIRYTGGGPPKETFIYVGNSFVEEGFKKHPIIIPAREQKVNPPY